MQRAQNGFTLMEMIGVIAVIAILGSMATPMIFEAIRNARITAFAADVNTARTAVAQFYQDTGRFPVLHRPDSTTDGERILFVNATNSPISGWDGPYIEQELENPFSTNLVAVRTVSDAGNHQFDLDGDGNMDTTTAVFYQVNGVTDADAKKINDIFDSDGDVTSGTGAWNRAGRVKRHGVTGNHPHALLIFISRA